MKRLLKWTAIGLAAAAGVALLAAVAMMLATDMRLAKSYTVAVAPPAIASDPAAIEQGRHLAEVYCTRCHGEKLEGGPFFADASLGLVDAPNLTQGSGGVGAAYADGDWARAIRHGIRPDGKPLFIMPSGDFQHFGEDDLAALIAYLKPRASCGQPNAGTRVYAAGAHPLHSGRVWGPDPGRVDRP